MGNILMYILFIVGLILIIKGGDFFVDAASWIARASGIPKFIIGATIVSLATTLPEIIVSATAAAQGKVDMAIGNAIGSVTANTGLILSIGMLFLPGIVERRHFMTKGITLIVTIITLLLLSLSGELTLLKSIALLAIFAFFIYDNIRAGKEDARLQNGDHTDSQKEPVNAKIVTINIIKFVLGAAGIVIGSNLLVDNGSAIASSLGVPENVISLTAIAIGTSLPELVTTITAIIRKESALSVGNVVGANIIDTALILPVCAMVSGGSIPVSQQTIGLDMPICLAVALIAVIPTIITQKLHRWQGVLSLLMYFGYMAIICFVI